MKFIILLKNKFNNEQGATSVLVIFMLIVLVTFGAFAITSAKANINFSKKAISWNTSYLNLSAVGQNFLLDMDASLAKAEEEAVKSVCGNDYNNLPENLQNTVINGFDSADDYNAYVNTAVNYVYYYNALNLLQGLKEKYQTVSIDSNTDEETGEVTDIMLTLPLTSPDDPDFMMNIKITVLPVSYDISSSGSGYTGTRIAGSRYNIDEWKQIQAPKKYTNDNSIWNGIIN